MMKITEENHDINNLMNKINKLEEKVKFIAFGKTKVKTKKPHIDIKKNKNNYDNIKIQRCMVERTVDELRNNNLGKVTNIFKLKKKILNIDKKPISSAVINHVNGKLMITDEEIMESIANYCQSNLKKDKRV